MISKEEAKRVANSVLDIQQKEFEQKKTAFLKKSIDYVNGVIGDLCAGGVFLATIPIKKIIIDHDCHYGEEPYPNNVRIKTIIDGIVDELKKNNFKTEANNGFINVSWRD